MTSAEGGFAAAQEGLKAIGGQTQWINSQVGAGKLALDPEAAEKAAKRCEDEIRALARVMRDADQITRVSGLGNYPDGKDLTQRFVDKASANGTGAVDLVRQLQDELKKQAEAFRAAAKDYRATDEQNADDLRRGIQ